MDTGMSSDSESNSYSGLLEFNLHANSFDRDFSKFDPNDFPNLLSDTGKRPLKILHKTVSSF